jgi:hypothetical protein
LLRFQVPKKNESTFFFFIFIIFFGRVLVTHFGHRSLFFCACVYRRWKEEEKKGVS